MESKFWHSHARKLLPVQLLVCVFSWALLIIIIAYWANLSHLIVEEEREVVPWRLVYRRIVSDWQTPLLMDLVRASDGCSAPLEYPFIQANITSTHFLSIEEDSRVAGVDPNYIMNDLVLCGMPLPTDTKLNLTQVESRLNPATGQCFEDHIPCSRGASETNTICIPSDEQISVSCPLTDVRFTDAFVVENVNQEFSAAYKETSLGRTGLDLMASKFTDRGPLATYFASEETPCLIPAENRTSCDITDSRFAHTGLTLTLFDIVQLTADDNFGKIDFFQQLEETDQSQVERQFGLYTRSAATWDYKCNSAAETSSDHIYHTMQTLLDRDEKEELTKTVIEPSYSQLPYLEVVLLGVASLTVCIAISQNFLLTPERTKKFAFAHAIVTLCLLQVLIVAYMIIVSHIFVGQLETQGKDLKMENSKVFSAVQDCSDTIFWQVEAPQVASPVNQDRISVFTISLYVYAVAVSAFALLNYLITRYQVEYWSSQLGTDMYSGTINSLFKRTQVELSQDSARDYQS